MHCCCYYQYLVDHRFKRLVSTAPPCIRKSMSAAWHSLFFGFSSLLTSFPFPPARTARPRTPGTWTRRPGVRKAARWRSTHFGRFIGRIVGSLWCFVPAKKQRGRVPNNGIKISKRRMSWIQRGKGGSVKIKDSKDNTTHTRRVLRSGWRFICAAVSSLN